MRGLLQLLRPGHTRKYLIGAFKHNPAIRGNLRVEVRDRGKLQTVREGSNIWTLTGREYLSEIQALQDSSPRTVFRDDRIAYLAVGTGAQPEVANVPSLVEPVVYKTGEYLAAVALPATFPLSSGGTRTSVRYIREFGKSEISLGFSVVLTEAGLFTDGDPDNNFDVPAPTDFSTVSGRAPMAYKTYEPVTKTTDFTLRYIWDVRIL